MIDAIKSNRKFEKSASWQIVYEWEDITSKKLNAKIYQNDFFLFLFKYFFPFSSLKVRTLRKYLNYKRLKASVLVYHIIPLTSKMLVPSNDIPIIIDFWKNICLEDFKRSYSKCKYIIVTSKEVYNYLLPKLKVPLHYMPLSLPDQYYRGNYDLEKNKQLIISKDIDIIQPGRANSVFNEWVETYLKKHPAIHYVYQKKIDSKLYFFSNKIGVIGESQTREDYFNMLKRAKISLYSSPGIDDGFKRTGGFNPLTPKFLECLSQFSYILGRFVDNEEYVEVAEFCANCVEYQAFEAMINSFLDNPLDDSYFNKADAFLKKNLTSSVIENYLRKVI